MASQASTVAFIAEQVARAGAVSARKLFGEYGIYCDGKLTALVCDDRLFVKPTEAGRAHVGEVEEMPPYKGAKPCFLVAGDRWDDRDWLTTLIRVSAAELPRPGPSRRRGEGVSGVNSRKPDPELSGPRGHIATFRPVVRSDVPALKALIDAIELFPSDMLEPMLSPYFELEPESRQFWLAGDEGGPVAVAYYAPERMTEGTWNLYLIAVHPKRQGTGLGSALLRRVEAALIERGERVLLVETSGLPAYRRTRDFYAGHGYVEEARIRDFYQPGEDKIIFRKLLGDLSPK